jgi:hypothetical protein
MAKQTPFEHLPTLDDGGGSTCAVCQAMLPEAVDLSAAGLTAAERAAFEKHLAGCVECSREFAEAQRGVAWLALLKSQSPEPPSGLLASILALTPTQSQAHSPAHSPSAAAAPQFSSSPLPAFAAPAYALPPRRALAQRQPWFSLQSLAFTAQPRLAMTAAMAFFSIALTLNLSGVRLRDLRAENFTPSGLRRTVADADASLTRTFQNSRVVYQVESRVSELGNDDPLPAR